MVHVRFSIVVCRNLVTFSTFLVEAKPPALSLLIIIFNAYASTITIFLNTRQ